MNVTKVRHLTEKLKCQNNKEMNFDLIQDLKKTGEKFAHRSLY